MYDVVAAANKFRDYVKNTKQPMRPFVLGEDLESQGISVWEGDVPEPGGMVARNPKDPKDQWYVSKKFFDENYIPAW